MRVKTARTSLTTQPLNPRLDKMIAAYATAAGAVGVALLATAPSVEAEIIYTKAKVTITDAARYHLDLNHDRVGDFSIGFCSCVPHGRGFTVSSERGVGNAAIVQSSFAYSALALTAGAAIGPKQKFRSVAGEGLRMAVSGYYVSSGYSGGPWMGAIDHYLGLKFTIDGEVHYGWARMTITKHIGHVVLTGYAYETIPNQHLKAGQTSETPQDEVKNADTWALPVQGPSLGMLARGVETMEIWRRKENDLVA
jgi:hypothetical protein